MGRVAGVRLAVAAAGRDAGDHGDELLERAIDGAAGEDGAHECGEPAQDVGAAAHREHAARDEAHHLLDQLEHRLEFGELFSIERRYVRHRARPRFQLKGSLFAIFSPLAAATSRSAAARRASG